MEQSKQLLNHASYAAIVAAVGVLLTFITHAAVEPKITHSQEQASSTFSIQQTITAETAFAVEPTDVTMVGSISGLTGGQATGSTQFSVITNNSAGYYVDIAFEDNGTEEAMIGDVTADESIRDYDGDDFTVPSDPQPSVGYTASTAAQFAYTVLSSTTADTDASFFNDGANCNTGGSQAITCWKAPSTTPFRIVERTSTATTWATSTVQFSVVVPSSPDSVPAAETYTATATLSLYNL